MKPASKLDINDLRRAIAGTEQDLLGFCLSNPAAFTSARGMIGDGSFFEPIHVSIWGAMCAAGDANMPTTGSSVIRRLPGAMVGDLTIAQYVARLMTETTIPATGLTGTLEWLRQQWANNELYAALVLARDAVVNPSTRTRDVTAALLADIDVIRASLERGSRMERGLIGDFADDYVQTLRGRLDGSVSNPALMTGLRDLDTMLGGILPETLMVIAGRPGMGKTVGATSIALRAARSGKRVAFFSLEMGAGQMVPRCLSNLTYRSAHGLPYQDIIKADPRWLREEHLRAIEEAQEKLRSMPLVLDTIASPNVAEITSRCRTAADMLEGKLDLIAVDYLGLMSASKRYAGSKVNETAEITAGLKALTNQTGTPIILVCQLSRTVEQRGDKRPQLSDLRDSGAIEQDADVVIFPYREAYYLDKNKDTEKLIDLQHKVEMIVAKNRHGATGSVDLFANVACSIFDNQGIM